MYTKSLLLAGLASFASAHIKMSSPAPYGQATLNNSPLLPDGSDFPCKQRAGVYDAAGASNIFAQGSKQQLEFVGTAVHGGGSCQVAITADTAPDANSVWKVIKSIEGGCPAKDQIGNMGDDANAKVPYSYEYTIPAELAAGNYTIAWMWSNKIGNREQYMNCGPLTVTGDKADDGLLDSLPDMFVANIGNDCETLPNKDVAYPNPGKDVDRFNGNTDAFAAPTGAGCAAGGGGGGNSPAPTGGSEPPSAPKPSAPAAKPTVPGGVFITAPGGDAPEPTAAPEPTTAPSPPAPVPDTPEAPKEPVAEKPVTEQPPTKKPDVVKPEVPSNGSGNAPSGGFTAGTPCTSEGDWNCVGGSAFQRCASGAWSQVMGLAAGVSCNGGQSSTLNIASRSGKRAMRRASRIRVI